MSKAKDPKRSAQKGFIAILLLVTIAVAAVAVLSKNIWGGDSKAMQQQQTQLALKQAKEALLAYVEVGIPSNLGTAGLYNAAGTPTLFDPNQPPYGRLPCPNFSGDGTSTAPCGGFGVHTIGLFPWATLNTPVLREAAHECLWYAVDGLFKIGTGSNPFAIPPTSGTRTDAAEVRNAPVMTVNSDSFGSFSVIQPVKNSDGTWFEQLLAGNPSTAVSTDATRVVAVIIAPNAPVAAQSRAGGGANPCATPTGDTRADVAQYLENYTGTITSGYNQLNPKGLTAHINPIPAPTNTQLNTFIQADTGQEKLNDQLIFITAEEFSSAVTKRTARLLATVLKRYAVMHGGAYPQPAIAPGGTCHVGMPLVLQGFIPFSCPAGTSLFPDTYTQRNPRPPPATIPLPSRWNTDPDWWASQAHYAVSQGCLTGSPVAALPCVDAAGNAPTPATAAAPTNLGGHALILMRGRPTAGQACTRTNRALPADPVPPLPIDMSLCLEGTVNPIAAGGLPANGTGLIGDAVFGRPPASSNDYLVLLP